MITINKILGLCAALLLSTAACATDIQVLSAWATASAPGQAVGKADLVLVSKGGAMLTGASSTVAKSVELHSMSNEGGMMKMREVKTIALPAGKRVNLGESGYHLMLMGLKAQLKVGDKVPLTLTVSSADKGKVSIPVMAEVKPVAGMDMSGHEDMHHHMH